jgi:hypothetical protein
MKTHSVGDNAADVVNEDDDYDDNSGLKVAIVTSSTLLIKYTSH